MFITKSNYQENKLFVNTFFRLLTILTRKFAVFGGVVRDLIVPLCLHDLNINIPDFETLLELEDGINLNDIDLMQACYNDEDCKTDTFELHSIIKNSGFIISNTENIDDYNATLATKLMIYDPFNDIDSISLDFVCHDIHKTTPLVNFDVNNLKWSNEFEFDLVERSQIKYLNYRLNKKSNLYSYAHLKYKYIDDVFENIRNKRCNILPGFDMSMPKFIKGLRKIMEKNFVVENIRTVELFKNMTTVHEGQEYEDPCIICKDPIANGDVIMVVCESQKHVYHSNCMMLWLEKNDRYACCICRNKRSHVE